MGRLTHTGIVWPVLGCGHEPRQRPAGQYLRSVGAVEALIVGIALLIVGPAGDGCYDAARAAALSGIHGTTVYWWARHGIVVASARSQPVSPVGDRPSVERRPIQPGNNDLALMNGHKSAEAQ